MSRFSLPQLPALNPPYDPDMVYDTPLVEQTQSSIGTALTCQAKYVYRYLMGLVLPGVSPALVIGSAVHEVFDYLFDPKNKAVPEQKLAANIRKIIDKFFADTLEAIGIADTALVDKINYGHKQATAIVTAWQIINGGWRDEFEFLHTEFSVRSLPEATLDSPMDDRLAGKIDGLIYSRLVSGLLLAEHKTRYSMKGFNGGDSLALNHQTNFYAVLYEAWLKRRPHMLAEIAKQAKKRKLSLEVPSGFYYNVIVKPLHRTGDTFDELVNRMVAAMVENPDNYFFLAPVEISHESVEWNRENFRREIGHIDRLKPGNVQHNTTACDDFGGCPYKPLCKAHADVNDPKSVFAKDEIVLYNIVDVHQELNDEEAVEG